MNVSEALNARQCYRGSRRPLGGSAALIDLP